MKTGEKIDVHSDPGEGNLRPRAYVASLLGPRRIAHGARKVFRLEPDALRLVAQNAVRSGPECLFVAIWLPVQVQGGRQLVVSSDENGGESAYLAQLSAGSGGSIGTRFEAVLLPNEELHVSAGPALGSVGNATAFSVVVSTVSF